MCRTVILFELDHFSTDKVAFELNDVANVCTAKRIDRLVAIAHHSQRGPRNAAARIEFKWPHRRRQPFDLFGFNTTRKLSNQRILGVIGVLVLVNENVSKPALINRGNVWVSPKQVHGLPNQVVKVEGICTAQLLFVFVKDLNEYAFSGVGFVGGRSVTRSVEQLILEPGDL